MNVALFFRTPDVTRALERAARCAGMPVAAHRPQGSKWAKVFGMEPCSACAYVSSTPGGKPACDKCLAGAAAAAARSGMSRPFICHAGFACLCAPAPGGAVLTFGPYCPAEQPESLATDFLAGLAALGEEAGTPPVSLADVRIIPSSAVPALAAWTVEALEALWAHQLASEQAPEEPEEEDRDETRRRPRTAKTADPYGAAAIAAALGGGAHHKARALFRAALSETTGGKKTAIAVKRARAVAAAAAVLEAAARASLPIETCWRHFPDLLGETQRARNELQLANAGMRLLGRIKREQKKTAPAESRAFGELAEIVASNFESGITLHEVADRLGQTPSAITHRLQRNFGMSFSDYVGRLRIDRAKELLRRTKLTAEAVGRRVGVDDPSNFRKLFKKFETISPQEYRKRFGVKK